MKSQNASKIEKENVIPKQHRFSIDALIDFGGKKAPKKEVKKKEVKGKQEVGEKQEIPKLNIETDKLIVILKQNNEVLEAKKLKIAFEIKF